WDGSLVGEQAAKGSSIPTAAPLAGERKVIAHRAFQELSAGGLVNLGVGVPEGVAVMLEAAQRAGSAPPATLTTEAGMFGGFPSAGPRFGTSRGAGGRTTLATMIDLYVGGGVDTAVLGMAQVDEHGCVNVSNFGPRSPGCGGFIDISQNAKAVVFAGTFTSGGLRVRVGRGRLEILSEGRQRKFLKRVVEITFNARHLAPGQSVLYVTERAVFKLRPDGGGLQLVEIAPGVDLHKDVLAHMDFAPVVEKVERMPSELFWPMP
ncbi:hypothetical protein H632_c1002p1, partial [Helicosporidium sp. ATCC 50920]